MIEKKKKIELQQFFIPIVNECLRGKIIKSRDFYVYNFQQRKKMNVAPDNIGSFERMCDERYPKSLLIGFGFIFQRNPKTNAIYYESLRLI